MNRIELLTTRVQELYEGKNPNRDPIADWLYENHIFQVAKEARSIAERFGGEPALAEAAGMLHDIGDAVISRFNSSHAKKSENIARDFLVESGFSNEEIKVILDDSIRRHSCRDGNVPVTLEGRAVATGDAIVHLTTNFYVFMTRMQKERGDSQEAISNWVKEKLDRDFNKKIFFDEVRKDVESDYKRLRQLFLS